MLVLAAEKGGSHEFGVATSAGLPVGEQARVLGLAGQLLRTRGQFEGAALLDRVNFAVREAGNELGESFYVLHAEVPIAAYEELRKKLTQQPKLFETIREVLCNDCGFHVRFIACEPRADEVQQPGEGTPSTAALERAIGEMGKLLIAIATRERSLKDADTNDEYIRLRKELLRYATLVEPPPLIKNANDGWSFWKEVANAAPTYATRRQFIAENFRKYYDNALGSSSFIDLNTFFSRRDLQLMEQVGEGGFGAVYRAEHTVLRAPRAIKIFDPRFYKGDEEALRRFAREAEFLSRLQHPHIVRFFDAGIAAGGYPFIVTEFLEGRDLEEQLKDSLLDYHHACEACIQVLEALHAAHKAGIVHRDVKPRNIMWRNGVAKLLDFGAGGVLREALSSRLTKTAIGTSGYIAPELYDDPQLLDPRLDIYSVGVVAHKLVTGRLLNPADAGHHLVGARVPDVFVAVVRKATLPMKQRYQEASEMVEAFRNVIKQRQTVAIANVSPRSEHTPLLLVEEGDILGILGVGPHSELSREWLAWARAELLGAWESSISDDGAKTVLRLVALLKEVSQYLAKDREYDFVVEEELRRAGAILLGLAGATPEASIRLVTSGLRTAVKFVWLQEEVYDTWAPGMPSGSGIRTRYYLTPLGRKELRNMGAAAPPEWPPTDGTKSQ